MVLQQSMWGAPDSASQWSPPKGSTWTPKASPFELAKQDKDEPLDGAEIKPSKRYKTPVTYLLMGRRGKGKTLYMTAMANHMQQQFRMPEHTPGYHLFSNYWMEFLRKGMDYYDPMMVNTIQSYPKWFRNGYLALDEIQTMASGRRSMSNANVGIATMLTQIRHRNVEPIFTTQFPQVLDYQVLLQIDMFIEVDTVEKKHDLPSVLDLYLHDYWGQFTGKMYRKTWPPPRYDADGRRRAFNVAPMIGKYNTDQIIAPAFMPEEARRNLVEEEESLMGSDWLDVVEPEVHKAQEVMENDPGARYESLQDFFGRKNSRFALRPALAVANEVDKDVVNESDLRDWLLNHGYTVYQSRGAWYGEPEED